MVYITGRRFLWLSLITTPPPTLQHSNTPTNSLPFYYHSQLPNINPHTTVIMAGMIDKVKAIMHKDKSHGESLQALLSSFNP
jgi:hypothetical protein